MDFDKLIQKAMQYTARNQENTSMVFSVHEFSLEQLIDFKNKMYTKFNFDQNENDIRRLRELLECY